MSKFVSIQEKLEGLQAMTVLVKSMWRVMWQPEMVHSVHYKTITSLYKHA